MAILGIIILIVGGSIIANSRGGSGEMVGAVVMILGLLLTLIGLLLS